MAQDRILWLTDAHGLSDKTKFALNFVLQREKLSLSQIYFVCIRQAADTPIVEMERELNKYLEMFKPKMVVCNDELTLRIFCGNRANLFLSRGSVYWYNGYSVLCIDSPSNWHNVWITQSGKKMHIAGRWVLKNDVEKLARWMNDRPRRQPRFNYKVCHTVHDLADAIEYLTKCIIISPDIETHPGRITCVGYAGLAPDGRIFSYVIPFYNPFKPQNSHWSRIEDEEHAWAAVQKINACAALKSLQNGGYDSKYFIKYHVPLTNYLLDVMHLFHSIWTEAPKKLNFISSILLDYCRYWKDENKEEEGGKASARKFKNMDSLERYWRYNALDCYNTICNTRVLLAIISRLPWALSNYNTEFSLQVGPALAGSMRGLRVNKERLKFKEYELNGQHVQNLFELRTMCDDMEFNPNSSDQVVHLIYKVLGGKMPKLKGKAAQKQAEKKKQFSADATILDMVAEQHPILDAFIQKIYAVKEPKNNVSKYCRDGRTKQAKEYPNGRFYYSLSAAGTETGRFSGKKHDFGFGTNPQNLPEPMRDFVVADDGYLYFEPDYSQSDARFVAYESQDQNYIYNVESGKDTHCLHAAHFFRPRTYEEILEGYKSGDPFYAHNVTGIRQITKKIVHGKNYNMAGFTLYMQMGRKATVAAAQAKGYKDAALWSVERLANFCQSLLNDYDKMYPRLQPWQKEEMEAGRKNGNKITCAFGRTRLFFGDLMEDKQAQREAIAYYGQGGTAGNINRVLNRIYYNEREFGGRIIFMTQTHDSILFQLPISKGISEAHEYAQKILTIMAEPVTIHGRQLVVPTDAKIGFSWTKGCIKYRPDLTLDELRSKQSEIDRSYDKIRAALAA